MTAIEIVIIILLPALFLGSEIFLNRIARHSGSGIQETGEK